MNAIADHVWQSTLFAGVVWLLTFALRKNHARVRHWLWFAASMKFLIPFSVFIALGSQVHWRTAPVTAPANITIVMDEVAQPFTAPAVVANVPPAPSPLPAILLGVWACGFIGITCAWWIRWRRIRAAVRAGSPLKLDLPIRAMSSPTLLEPGVFGIFRPILLLPEGIFDRLTPAQLQAVIAHELCHVRHRDNLIAALHMFVETVFWFHPLVWWIGKRMVEERERACDEEVLRELAEPKAYAEGILNVCKLYTESPLTCASGVTGSNLKKRIEAIMINRIAIKLTFAKKAALAVVGMAAVAVPFVVGLLNAPSARAQSPQPVSAAPIKASTPSQGGAGSSTDKQLAFDAASVKPTSPNRPDGAITVGMAAPTGGPGTNSPGRIHYPVTSLKFLLFNAYGVGVRQIVGPDWLDSEYFEVNATMPPNTTREEFQAMLQNLLADRFKLKLHRETRTTESPRYSLVVARSGPKMKMSVKGPPQEDGAAPPPPRPLRIDNDGFPVLPPLPAGRATNLYIEGGHGLLVRFVVQRQTMTELAQRLGGFLKSTVTDDTGLTGQYDFTLTFSRDDLPVVPDTDSTPDIFTALQSQLGLKLEKHGSVPVETIYIVVDHAEKRPSEN
jgi:uncharacterized protein (TIGR03435 family)